VSIKIRVRVHRYVYTVLSEYSLGQIRPIVLRPKGVGVMGPVSYANMGSNDNLHQAYELLLDALADAKAAVALYMKQGVLLTV
jgi:hypothetical protein